MEFTYYFKLGLQIIFGGIVAALIAAVFIGRWWK